MLFLNGRYNSIYTELLTLFHLRQKSMYEIIDAVSETRSLQDLALHADIFQDSKGRALWLFSLVLSTSICIFLSSRIFIDQNNNRFFNKHICELCAELSCTLFPKNIISFYLWARSTSTEVRWGGSGAGGD